MNQEKEASQPNYVLAELDEELATYRDVNVVVSYKIPLAPAK
jgi:hypothetical protein